MSRRWHHKTQTMKKVLFILFSLLLPLFTFAQQEMVIKGTVVNTETNEVVPFANISVFNEALGTVTNLIGEYELHIPITYSNKTLAISCVGYFTYKIPIVDIKNKRQFIINIAPRAYQLDEFTVRPGELNAEQVVAEAIKRIPNNYITKPYTMDGFYREYFEENGQYVAFAEAAVSIYDYFAYELNDNKVKEAIKINQLRVSDILNQGEYVLYIDINYALRGNLIRNYEFWNTYAQRAKFEKLHLAIDALTYYDDDLVYVISYIVNSKKWGTYKGRLFIRQNDFAVIRVEIDAHNLFRGREENGAPNRSFAVMTYKEHQGKLYLNYVYANHDVRYIVNENEQYDLSFYSELHVHNINTEQARPLAQNERVKQASIYYQPRYRTYDPNFWESYTMFEESPANQQIISDLEIERGLYKQYEANGKLKSIYDRINSPYSNSNSQGASGNLYSND